MDPGANAALIFLTLFLTAIFIVAGTTPPILSTSVLTTEDPGHCAANGEPNHCNTREQQGKESPVKMELSVIVPTYNETENIRPLCERLFVACRKKDLNVELLVMDDESPGSEETARIVAELAKEKYSIRMHMRKETEGRGLSSAVLLGFEKAKYETVLCMDADLQHEPESVPSLAIPVLKSEADFSIGSRNVGGGG
jgi:dolichol-phosphate mannosyltransferase